MGKRADILGVSYYFPPLAGPGSARMVAFTRYLPEYGFHVDVLTVRDAYHWALDTGLSEGVPGTTAVYRTAAFLPLSYLKRRFERPGKATDGKTATLRSQLILLVRNWVNTLICFPDEFTGWVPFAVRKAAAVLRRRPYRLLLSTSPPNSVHLAALWIKKQSGLPWVADFRDLWDQYPYSYNPYAFRTRARLEEILERIVVEYADAITIATASMRDHLVQKYGNRVKEKVFVLHNGYDFGASGTAAPQEALQPDRIKILHTGTLFSWRKTRPLFEALQRFFRGNPSARNHFLFEFCGTDASDLRANIEMFGLKDVVRTRDYVSYREMPALFTDVDWALVLVGRLPKVEFILPLKVFDALGAGKPLLVIGPEGEARRFVRQYEIGLEADDEDPEELSRMLDHVYGDFLKRRSLRNRYRDSVLHIRPQFHRRHVLRKMAEICTSLLD